MVIFGVPINGKFFNSSSKRIKEKVNSGHLKIRTNKKTELLDRNLLLLSPALTVSHILKFPLSLKAPSRLSSFSQTAYFRPIALLTTIIYYLLFLSYINSYNR